MWATESGQLRPVTGIKETTSNAGVLNKEFSKNQTIFHRYSQFFLPTIQPLDLMTNFLATTELK
jgi:hypothetical protein